jgi:hypothetical protein
MALKDDKGQAQNGGLQTDQSVNYFVNQFLLYGTRHAGVVTRQVTT